MRTNENVPRYSPLLLNIHQGIDGYEEKVQMTTKEHSFYFNNSKLCQYYGQSNIEKCIFVLFSLIIFSSSLLYHYFNILNSFIFYTMLTTLVIDSISFIFYSFFLYRLRTEKLFENVPSRAIKFNDFIIFFNSIGKSLLMVLVCLNFWGWFPFCLFLGKFLVEIYFLMISFKLFLFCPGTRFIQEQSEKIWTFIKFYVLCFEPEQEQDNGEYTKIEDLESFY